jgi:hypothetical protein
VTESAEGPLADCEIFRVSPPAVTVALLAAGTELTAAVSVSVPFPDPLPGLTVSQLAVELAVQAHPLVATRFAVIEPPTAPTLNPLAISEIPQMLPTWLIV